MGAGRIVFIEPNGNRSFINCSSIPPLDGSTTGSLTIEGCKIKTNVVGPDQYKFLSIPKDPNPSSPDIDPNTDIIIILHEDIHENRMVLPYNGGTPLVEISIKLNVGP